MAFLGGLVAVFILLWVVGYLFNVVALRDTRFDARAASAVMFTFIGVSHVVKPEMLTYMVEGMLPYPLLVVYVSGVSEIILGLGLLYPPTQRICAWGLLLLLLAIFPANIYVAINQLTPPGGLPAKPWYVWSRLAFQPLYMLWVWFAALHRSGVTMSSTDSKPAVQAMQPPVV